MAALHLQKNKALKVLAKYSRFTEPKKLDQIYDDSISYLERAPRVQPEAVAAILEFIGKKEIPLETIADNSIVDRLTREGLMDKLYKSR